MPNQLNTGALYTQGDWDTLVNAPSPDIVTAVPSPLLRFLQPHNVVSSGNVAASAGTPWFDPTADLSLQINWQSDQPPPANEGGTGLMWTSPTGNEFITVNSTYNATAGAGMIDILVYATDNTNSDLIYADTIAAAASTPHGLYLKRVANVWEFYLDGSLIASLPSTVTFTESGWKPSIGEDGVNLLYLPRVRFAIWAQPAIAIQIPSFKGPVT